MFGAPAPEVTLGNYRLGERLGQGGAGTVYAATHRAGGESVALKVLDATTSTGERRLLREAKVLQDLAHPNVVRVLAVEDNEDRRFVVMERLEGGTLARWLGAEHSALEVVSMISAIAAGLEAAHALGVVHRDVKPTNVLLTKDGTPKVADFGLAKAIEGSEADEMSAFGSRLTATGATMGTVGYMAPEQLLARPVSAATDQFALGVLAHEALFGVPPFEGKTLDAIALAVINGQVREGPKEGGPLRSVLVRAMAPEPNRRFDSVTAFAEALDEAARGKKRGWLASLLGR